MSDQISKENWQIEVNPSVRYSSQHKTYGARDCFGSSCRSLDEVEEYLNEPQSDMIDRYFRRLTSTH